LKRCQLHLIVSSIFGHRFTSISRFGTENLSFTHTS